MTAAPAPLRIAVLTISDSRSLNEDRSGQALVELLEAAGHELADRRLVPDDRYAIRAEVSRWIADPSIDCVLTTGGTGLTGRDGTPEAILPLLDKEITGFGEIFRFLSYQEIGTSSLQSRALAGVANGTFLFVLPGSTGACRTAWNRIIQAQLDARTGPCNLTVLMPRLLER
jgi:molybdopterin adenylyltransferase